MKGLLMKRWFASTLFLLIACNSVADQHDANEYPKVPFSSHTPEVQSEEMLGLSESSSPSGGDGVSVSPAILSGDTMPVLDASENIFATNLNQDNTQIRDDQESLNLDVCLTHEESHVFKNDSTASDVKCSQITLHSQNDRGDLSIAVAKEEGVLENNTTYWGIIKECGLQASFFDIPFVLPLAVFSPRPGGLLFTTVSGRIATCMIRSIGGNITNSYDIADEIQRLGWHSLVGASGGAVKYAICGQDPKLGALNHALNQVSGEILKNNPIVSIGSGAAIEFVEAVVSCGFLYLGYQGSIPSNSYSNLVFSRTNAAIKVALGSTLYSIYKNWPQLRWSVVTVVSTGTVGAMSYKLVNNLAIPGPL